MKLVFLGTSSAAVLMGLALPALGQQSVQKPGTDDNGSLAEIVVTGSFIRGTPVDAALPVEVYSRQQLEKEGSPTALEFAKNLTISGPTTGESYYFGGPTLIGSVNYNLRGLGSDKTLILLNGRRMDINTANIPSLALERTEILKEGAAVIYGADATGGVVNFITRERFVGIDMNAQYKYIDGSDGDYSAAVLGGIGEGRVNLMVSAEYEHRSRLHALDRDFTRTSLDPTKPGYNPAPWSTLTNLAGWVPRGTLPAVPGVSADAEFGAPTGGIVADFTPQSCTAVGGRYDNNFTCAYNYIPYYNVVEDNDIYRGFAQLNAEISDNMDFHLDAAYAQVTSPQVFASPAQPIVRGPAMSTGSTFQLYVPISNPYAADFAARNGVVGASGFTPVTYRLLGHGGNFAFGDGEGYGVPDRIDNEIWRLSAGLNGTLGAWAGAARNVGYDFAVTYNHSNAYNTHPDTIGYRVQQALNGFGGAGCQAADLDPARFGTQNPGAAGKNGCMWWNPFSTSFANQPVRNLANPNYVAGAENSMELTRWMFDPRATKTVNENTTVDLVFDGTLGLTLPGGELGWALGGQYRDVKSREDIPGPFYDGSLPCEWPSEFTSANGPGSPNLPASPLATNDPGFRGCTPDNPGPFVLFAPNPNDTLGRHQYSTFVELRIPVLSNLDFQAAARHEEFSDGLGATVYKLAGKWNVWGPLSFRGSYGTNYQTPPLGVVPGNITVAARTYTVAASNWLAAQFITDSNLKPETARAKNFGAIWQSDGFASGHYFQFILDYFDIQTEDQIGQVADPNQIASLVFNGAGNTITTCDPSVQPLVNRITFNVPCTVGMSGVGAFSSVSTRFGNGPGQSTNGLDLQTTYEMPLAAGNLTLGLRATRILELETGPTSLDGIVVSMGDDRLGSLNFATFAQSAPEWRANFSADYSVDRHNVRLGVNFVSAVQDERPGVQYGENGEDWITTDLTYRFVFDDGLAITATVANILDRDPPAAQEEFGYDPWTANPLGRTAEIGIRKTF
ncbi:TonB-dependent receptor domain-containing protein [Povalibacter sp.]|uniref:TonB-dependent receptor domain-containing protein n=1 Tax=Povalibacter sp. TaxID=1962978 RepID=UPI002F400847